MEVVGLGVGVRKLGVDLGFAERLASHLELTNEFVALAGIVGDLDDLGEVRGTLCLNVGLLE